MKRLMLAVAVSAMFAMALAAPAAAAPVSDHTGFTLTVTCGSQTWDAISVGPVGWVVDGPAATTPGVSLGGTHTIYVDGQVVSVETYAPPSGLADRLMV